MIKTESWKKSTHQRTLKKKGLVKLMKRIIMKRIMPLFIALMLIVMAIPGTTMAAEVKVELGTASTFAILAGTTVTNTGSTTITGGLPEGGGNIGIHDASGYTTALVGVTMTGWTIYVNDSVALQAKNDLTAAYLDAAGRTPTTTFTETDNQLGGKTLTAGVYAFGHADTANLTAANPLILDAQGDPDAVFIFQASSDLIMASGSVIQLRNGARYCRVFWQVTSSATLGTYSTFIGHIFALTSITAQTGATIQGQLLARNGAVTLDTNTITNALCNAAATATPTPTVTTAPTPTVTTAPTPTVTTAPTPIIPQTGDKSIDSTLIFGLLIASAILIFLASMKNRMGRKKK